mmetsp:Transcript_213/g.532  ORF Transcript_213/g.532 Transcript_213/m.532 type:complete len:216 (+) Transcript_213:733-1380(+)
MSRCIMTLRTWFGGSLSLARTLDRVRNVSCVVTKGSVDFEEGMSIAMSQAPFLHASLSQNTDAAPNVQTGRCAPVGSTPRQCSMRLTSVARLPPRLCPVRHKCAVPGGWFLKCSSMNGSRVAYMLNDSSYIPRCTLTFNDGSSKSTGSNATLVRHEAALLEPSMTMYLVAVFSSSAMNHSTTGGDDAAVVEEEEEEEALLPSSPAGSLFSVSSIA